MTVTAYEGFGVVTACTTDFEFYGLRSFWRRAGLVKFTCGYIQPTPPPTGEYKVTIPSRDADGFNGQLIATVVVTDWELLISSDAKGTLFTYEGYLHMGQTEGSTGDGEKVTNRLDFHPQTGDPIKVVDLV